MKTGFKKFSKILLFVLLAFVTAALVIRPDRYADATFTGIKVWALNVLPSLLPFFFITALMTGTGYLAKITGVLSPVTRFLYRADGLSAYVQIMSFLSGYPVGVKIASDLYRGGVIGSREVTKLSTFCSTSGPLFIVGTVGTAMFANKKAGLILLSAHLLSSVLCGIIFRFLPTDKESRPKAFLPKKSDNVLYESIYSAVISVAVVGGFIAIFFTFATILDDIGAFIPIVKILSPVVGENNADGIAIGLIECTFACRTFAAVTDPVSVSLACGAVSFGGLSVWCQSAVYLNAANADFKIFALSKLTHTVLGFIVCYGECLVLL